jgi:hypothetical protein
MQMNDSTLHLSAAVLVNKINYLLLCLSVLEAHEKKVKMDRHFHAGPYITPGLKSLLRSQ